MKRLLAAMALLCLSLVCLGAEQVKLKMAVWDINQTTYIEPMVQAYMAAHPNVSIELINISANDYDDKVAVMLAGGDTTDIISVKDMPQYAGMVAKKELLPLDSYIKKDGIDLKGYAGITDDISVGGALYALPYRSDIWVLFYNKDLFDKAKVAYPTNDMTWDQYATLARRMSSGDGVDRVYGSHYHIWRSTVQLPSVQDGKHSIISTDYSFMKPYYEMVLKMQKDKTVMDYASLRVGNIHYTGVFYNDQIAMMPMGTWFMGTLISKIKDGTASMKWGMVKLPHPPAVPAGTTFGTITSLAINAESEHQAAAWDFLKYFCGAEGALKLAGMGTLPALRNPGIVAALKNIDGFPKDNASAEALAIQKLMLEIPLHPKDGIVDKILSEEHELILTGSVTVDKGLADMSRRVKEALAQ